MTQDPLITVYGKAITQPYACQQHPRAAPLSQAVATPQISWSPPLSVTIPECYGQGHAHGSNGNAHSSDRYSPYQTAQITCSCAVAWDADRGRAGCRHRG
jgi:hypothetical protein